MSFKAQTTINLKNLHQNNVNLTNRMILALQHMFAMFGATVLVPALTGLDPAVALFTSGLGTLIFHLVTEGKVPAYLGSSFAFIAPIQAAAVVAGTGGVMVGILTVGLIYVITSILIKYIGLGFFRKLLPAVVVGPVIITIGLGLAGVARDMANQHLLTATITLAIAIYFTIFTKGIFKIIPILLGVIGGYLFAMTQGLVDFTPVANASWIALPSFTFPEFSGSLQVIAIIAPIALVTMVEHLGDVVALGSTTQKDYITDPGLHRTLLGDGLATALAGFFGGPPNTTYGENIGVLALTKVYNSFIIQLAAIFVLASSFIEKLGVLIRTIPEAVMGGIVFLLFGMIATVGLRTLNESKVDLNNNRNLVIISVILVIGISNLAISIGNVQIQGMGLAAIVGVLLNLILPEELDLNVEDKENMVIK